MTALWSLLLLFASSPTLDVVPEGEVPAWAVTHWEEDAGALSTALDGLFAAPREDQHLTINARWNPNAPQRMDIAAYAERDAISISLHGEGWAKEGAAGRLALQQNLAHELAHVWHLAAYDSLAEPRWIHEGFAQALSLAALERSDLWTTRDIMAFRAEQDELCGEVLAEGPIIEALERSDRRAVYACSFIVIDVTGGVTAKNPGAVFALYADGMMSGKGLARTVVDATPTGYLRRVRAFLYFDYTDQPPERIIANFRSGRL